MPNTTVIPFRPGGTLPAGCASQPLRADEIVTDQMLRDLAQVDAIQNLGELSAEKQRTLAMYLPDICGELLGLRGKERQGRL